MLEINVTVKCPDVIQAASILRDAISGGRGPSAAENPSSFIPAETQPSASQMPSAPSPMGSAPVSSVPGVPTQTTGQPPFNGQTAPAYPSPAAAPATVAPAVMQTNASSPSVTLEQISRAGAALATAGRMGDLMAIVAKHGVQALTQLKPEQYDAVAADLRALGAQI